MESLDTPNDHLFRGGNPNMNNWDDLPPLLQKDREQHGRKFETPQVYSFYHKMEGYHPSMDPFEHHFYDHRVPNYQPPAFGYSNIPELGSYSGGESDEPKMNLYTHDEPLIPNKVNEMRPEPARSSESEMSGGGEQRVVGGTDVAEGEIPWQVRELFWNQFLIHLMTIFLSWKGKLFIILLVWKQACFLKR